LSNTESGSKVSDVASENPNYRILPGDTLRIAIYDDEELSDGVERLVGEDGIITIPYVDVRVKVSALTTEQCKEEIRKRLIEEEMYHDPNLDVSISAFGKRFVLVVGHVERPGSVAFDDGKPMAIEEAIAKAGGFSRDKRAARNRVKLTRLDKGGRKITVLVDVEDIMRGKAKPVYLEPNDIIEVTEKFI
jgi:protein involved in polysaccharide export with SLBB domain